MSAAAFLRLVLAWLDATGSESFPPEWLLTTALASAPGMPPDLTADVTDQPPYRWLRIASSLDFAGDIHGARMLLDRVEAYAHSVRSGHDSRELLALICARRGRLARQLGDVEAAAEWYRIGLARTDGAKHRNARSSCVQGLANCAQYHNDLPVAERLSRLICVNHASVPRYARVNALLTTSVIYRKLGRVPAALRTAWQVHDLVDERDERRGSALVEISQLALERGERGAALRGFDVVLSFSQTARVRRPAHSGALFATLAECEHTASESSRGAVVARAQELLASVRECDQPWERANAHLDAITAFSAIGESELAKQSSAALQAELQHLAARGARLAWAQERLREMRHSPTVSASDPGLTAPSPIPLGRTEAHSLLRLTTLVPLHAVR